MFCDRRMQSPAPGVAGSVTGHQPVAPAQLANDQPHARPAGLPLDVAEYEQTFIWENYVLMFAGPFFERAAACVAVVTTLGLIGAQTGAPLAYPKAKRGNQVDNYHGKLIQDPFRQLEDPDNADTRAWIAAEQKLTEEWLARVPQRRAIKDRLTRLYNYERYPASVLTNFSRGFTWSFAGAFSAGEQHFVLRNSGLQNQFVLYLSDGKRDQVLLDPNTLRADGTAALCGLAPSHDGRMLAYGTAQAGSDWCEWHIRNVDNGQDLPDRLQWTKDTAPAWTPDNREFYYVVFPKPADDKLLTEVNRNARVLLHHVGQPASRDEFIYSDPAHPDSELGPVLTEDGRYLLVHEDLPDSSKNMLYFEDLTAAKPRMAPLTPDPAGLFAFVGSLNGRVFIRTTEGAPKGRIVAIDLRQPERSHWTTVVSEKAETLDGAIVAGEKLVVSYLKDAHAKAWIISLDGKVSHEVDLPGIGSATWSPAEPRATEAFYSFVSFTDPPSLYRLDLQTGRSTRVRQSRLSFDPNAYETQQIFYTSKDGTRVPMFLVHRRGLPLDSQNPTILYGYGGFNDAIKPSFTPAFLQWMEMGGVFAVANVRGGSEYGEAWHLAGARHHKQNVFDDFIAAGEWLIANKYTSRSKLAIFGASNGGLLVGACLNQRPDLFGAAMPSVGVMDMLRFQKFTAGAGWVGEYGSPENPADFPVLLAYSPLHNIRKTSYPPTLITTSDHDDRVVPGHSFKYAATLQEAQQGTAPILLRIETRAGHGAGRPTSKSIEEYADRWAFLVRALGLHPTF